jgi:hypothetical protein
VAAASEVDDFKSMVGPVVLGSLVYTGLAIGYVNLAHPDRGDLPLTLAISSYVPLTTTLGALVADVQDGKTVAGVTAGAALVSIPLAYLAAANTDLDPGDTQLVRDAGFWGLIIAFSTAVATTEYGDVTPRVGAIGLAGLYGGMGLGLLAAHYSEISLERTRVTTWGSPSSAPRRSTRRPKPPAWPRCATSSPPCCRWSPATAAPSCAPG